MVYKKTFRKRIMYQKEKTFEQDQINDQGFNRD